LSILLAAKAFFRIVGKCPSSCDAAAKTSFEESIEGHNARQGSPRAPRAIAEIERMPAASGVRSSHRFFELPAFGPNHLKAATGALIEPAIRKQEK
jgi:hypothetical protein